MKFKLIILSTFAFTLSFSQDRSIQFEKTEKFSEVLAKAKKENKLIFMDAYTTWCGPCKWMAKNMFTKNEIADYYNSNFINAKFDMEKGEGIELAKKYSVRCYPNLLFIDGDGNLVHRSAGAAQEVADYITLGETAKNPEIRFSTLSNQYESKKSDPQFLAKYIDAISMTCLPFDEEIKAYFDLQKEEDLTSQLNWTMIFKYIENYKSHEFNYLLSNKDKFASKYTLDSVDLKITDVFINSGNNILYSKEYSKKKFEDFSNEVKKLNFNGFEKVIFKLKLAEFEKNGEMKQMFDYAIGEGDKYLGDNEINSISWTIYEKSDDKKHLNKAAEWMEKLTAKDDGRTWQNMDTYAAVLFKLKNKSQALKVAEEAINIAKRTGITEGDYKATQDLVKEINKL